jgi:hypothetical protein
MHAYSVSFQVVVHFYIDKDMQNDVINPYLQKSAEVFKINFEQIPLVRLNGLMPFLVRPTHDIMFSLGDLREFVSRWIPSLNNSIRKLPSI